ncbi:helix-turn-helix transcriptional regulator [Thalassovita taeanensis]|uniref:Regulatory protein, luxR family n=1 Tax=Thalassovita taeanensis TaxID=657014 RepID=A0A1H9BFU1_9RHOB|nr:helix-turn-helix transcriptional regulator [Thalassovita taeanensis]SEP87138.1 regulatory protein, luxR family [Thalassovita taeanensis]
MSPDALKIDACLAALGAETFPRAYVDFVETLGIDQIMVFAIEDAGARCLLSFHYANAALAGQLASAYLDGCFLRDPLLPDLREASPNCIEVRTLEEITEAMDHDYRERFFDAPGLTAKSTVLAVGERLRLFVSLYCADPRSPDAGLSRLAGRLALMHFERAEGTGIPAALAILSRREQAVCVGILSGQKAEVIAADLGVAPSSVVTYRKRAYAKLGIASRAGLFAICSG